MPNSLMIDSYFFLLLSFRITKTHNLLAVGGWGSDLWLCPHTPAFREFINQTENCHLRQVTHRNDIKIT